jgi:hypothetical protein
MSARWLLLDAAGVHVQHADPRLAPHYVAGVDFGAAIKAVSPGLPKRLKQLAKNGEAATEKGKVVLYAGMAAQEIMLAIAPLKGADGKTSAVVVLFGV